MNLPYAAFLSITTSWGLISVQEAGDLNIKANQRVLVTEQSSADWCVFANDTQILIYIHVNAGGRVK